MVLLRSGDSLTRPCWWNCNGQGNVGWLGAHQLDSYEYHIQKAVSWEMFSTYQRYDVQIADCITTSAANRLIFLPPEENLWHKEVIQSSSRLSPCGSCWTYHTWVPSRRWNPKCHAASFLTRNERLPPNIRTCFPTNLSLKGPIIFYFSEAVQFWTPYNTVLVTYLCNVRLAWKLFFSFSCDFLIFFYFAFSRW